MARNLPLLVAIVFTVWIPGNLFANYLYYSTEGEDAAMGAYMRTGSLIEAFFGPLVMGAVITALAKLKLGETPGYGSSMANGFRWWGYLLSAQIVAGFIILGGLLLLIVPGVVWAVRFSMIAEAVVLESHGTKASRQRSWELTRDIGWTMFGVWCVGVIVYVLSGIAVLAPVGILQEAFEYDLPALILIDTLADSCLDLVLVLPSVVVFLYYWEHCERELTMSEETTGEMEGEVESL